MREILDHDLDLGGFAVYNPRPPVDPNDVVRLQDLVAIGGTPTGAAGGDLGGTYPNPTVTAIHETSGPTKLTIGGVADLAFLRRSGADLIGVTTIPYSVLTGTPTSLPPSGAAGGDLASTYPNPNVRGIHETGGPTQLLFGAIADGQTLVRSGGTIVGSTGAPPGGSAGGDLTGTFPNPTIATNVVSDAKFRQSVGTSVVGRAAGTTGNVADIVAGADGDVLRRAGGVLGFGAIPEASVTNLVSDLAARALAARTLTTTAPLTGGGDLTADRTLGITDFGASGIGHARGTVPDPGAVSGSTRFLREDASWAVPAYPTTLPPSGSAGGDLGGSYPNPTVLAVETTTGGGTRLLLGGIVDGTILQRSGTSIIGIATVPIGSLPTAATLGIGPSALGSAGVSSFLARADQVHAAYRSDMPIAPAWFIDTVNGNDANTGVTAAQSLKTWGELKRRWWGAELTSSVTVAVSGDPVAGDNGAWHFAMVPGVTVNFIGNLGAVAGGGGIVSDNTLFTGTVTSFTAAAVGPAADDNQLVDSSIPTSFTASGALNNGVILKRTSGTAIYGFALKDQGSRTLRTSFFATSANGDATLAPGDAYAGYTLYKAPLQAFPIAVVRQVVFQQLWDSDATSTFSLPTAYDRRRCWVSSARPISNQWFSCMIDLPSGVRNILPQTPLAFISHSAVRGNGTTSELILGGGCFEMNKNCFQGASLSADDTLLHITGSPIAFFDNSQPCILANFNSQIRFSASDGGGISGKGNTGKLLAVGPGIGSFYWGYAVGAVPFAAGSTTDASPITIGSTNYAVSALPNLADVNLANDTRFPSTVFETGGPTRLTWDAVPDLGYVRRSGTTLVGQTTIPYGVLTGTPTSLPPSGAASGDLAGTYPAPTVIALEETGGTRLVLNAIPDLGFFRRTGTAVVGVTTIPYGVLTGTPTSLPPDGAAGGDLSGTYPNPNVRGIHETSGPTQLLFGAIADGQTLQRVGTTIVGATGVAPGGSAGGDLSGSYPNPTVVALESTGTGAARLTIGSVQDGGYVKRSSAALVTVATIPYADLSGTPTSLPPSGAAGGDLTGSTYPNPTIAANVVTDAKLRQSAGLSAIGRSANSTGNVADIVASSDGDVLRRSGTTLGFGAIPEASVTNLTTDLAAKAPTSRTISTTSPLTGGGDLTANRTLGITDFVGPGASHARGAVPDPGLSPGAPLRFLREDATWVQAFDFTVAYSLIAAPLSSAFPGWFIPGNALSGSVIELWPYPATIGTRQIWLNVYVSISSGGTGSFNVIVTKNGVDTAIVATVAAATTGFQAALGTGITSVSTDTYGVRLDPTSLVGTCTVTMTVVMQII